MYQRHDEYLTSWRHLLRWGSPWGSAASGSLHSASKCSPPPDPERHRNREKEREMDRGPQDRGSAVTSHSAPKPTDPALSLGLDNATQRAHTCSTQRRAHARTQVLSILQLSYFSLSLTHSSPRCLSGSWTGQFSASCCHREPGRSTPERVTDRQVVDRDRHVGQTEVEGRWPGTHNTWEKWTTTGGQCLLYSSLRVLVH